MWMALMERGRVWWADNQRLDRKKMLEWKKGNRLQKPCRSLSILPFLLNETGSCSTSRGTDGHDIKIHIFKYVFKILLLKNSILTFEKPGRQSYNQHIKVNVSKYIIQILLHHVMSGLTVCILYISWTHSYICTHTDTYIWMVEKLMIIRNMKRAL